MKGARPAGRDGSTRAEPRARSQTAACRRPGGLVEHLVDLRAGPQPGPGARTCARESSGGAPIRSASATNVRTCRSARSRSAGSGSPTRVATPFTCTARAIVGGLNPTATAPFRSRFARIREPSGAETHKPSTTGRPQTPPVPSARANSGLRSSSRVATPTATPPWMNSTTAGSSTGRQLRPLHANEPTPAATRSPQAEPTSSASDRGGADADHECERCECCGGFRELDPERAGAGQHGGCDQRER